MKRLLHLFFTLLAVSVFAQQKQKTENVFLITTDGFRWQEVFNGADSAMLNDIQFVKNPNEIEPLFWSDTLEKRREKLLPFFWKTVASQGQLYGNRNYGNKVAVSNPFWFSYPGYNEILTGFSDKRINSNNKIENPNQTVLEFINKQKGFEGKVAAYTSWETFPFIINEKRSGIMVNSGLEPATGKSLTPKEELLNQLQSNVPSPWGSTRNDWITYYLAKEYIIKNQPRVFFLSFDETDDYAHAGNYDLYLKMGHMVDGFIADLWNYVQSNPKYRNKTTFIIATDHGRGHTPKKLWRDHGAKTPDSNEMWFAVMGPDTEPSGEMKSEGQLYQNQLAKTLAALLGLDYKNENNTVGETISTVIKK